MFKITHAVRCQKFEALAVIDGRILMTFEDDLWWCHGVEPGGLTAGGEGPFVAFERFCLSFREVLNDFAESCESFEAFREDAVTFFKTDRTEEERWNNAVVAVSRARSEGIPLEEPFRGMAVTTQRDATISIKLMVEFAQEPMSSVGSDPALSITMDKAA